MSLSSSYRTVTIFFSYATSSSTDKRWFNRLMTHLSMLRREHLIDRWYDSAISAGSSVVQTLQAYLQAADVIVLLLSAEFLASERCYELEMRLALERGRAGNARLIPVILSPTEWETLPLDGCQPLPANGATLSSSRNKEEALLEVALGIRRAVEELAGRASRLLTRPFSSGLPLSHFPYRQNDFFTDRETILSALHTAFHASQSKQTLILALNGLGGMGKTQIALEYLYRAARDYQAIIWLNASSRETLSGEIGALAERLGIPGKDRADEERMFTAVRYWLQAHTNWLLVLDHIDDLSLIDLVVPPQSNGHVLLTTRTQAVGTLSSVIPIAQMDNDASVLLLLQRARLLPARAPLSQAAPETVQQARAVARAVDGFPLALDQAGAYLEETGCDLASYLALFQAERAALLARRGRIHHQHHPDSVAITLNLAIEIVCQQRHANLLLLYLLAFLQPDAIPYELLVDGAREVSEPLRSLLTHELELHEALADLRGYSLLQSLSDITIFTLHRMVQAVLVDRLSRKQQRQWAGQVVRMVNRVFPQAISANLTACARYLPQARQCATLIATFKLTSKQGALLLRRLGVYCYQLAWYTEAASYLTQALHLHEQHQWSDEEELARVLNNLGLLAYRQAHYSEAEQLLLRALALYEQNAGSDELSTTESMHNLALLSTQLGNYQQAEHYYQRVLKIEERVLGPEPLESAKTFNNLGLLYYKQGNYPQAASAYQRALAIYTRELPPDHPDFIHPLDGLGALAEARGNFQEAADLYQRQLTLCQKVYGEDHPETAHSLNKLADIYEIMDRDQEASEFYLRALRIGEETLGSNHPDVALFLNNLAVLEEKQDHLQQAEHYYQRALHIYEQVLGAQHPHVADVLNNLGDLYRTRQREKDAEALFRRALDIREAALGSDHPDTAQSLSNLANLLATRHADQEAEELFRRAFAIRLQTFGPRHPHTESTREKYASLLERQGRNTEATALRQTTYTATDARSAEQS